MSVCDGALLNGKCFQYFSLGATAQISHADARASCLAWGGNLATISSEQESNLAVLLKNTAGHTYGWIGLKWIRATGVWQWEEGGTVYPLDVNNKDVWAWGCAGSGCQPDFDPGTGDNCVHYWGTTWNELACDWQGVAGLGHVCTKAAAACDSGTGLVAATSASFAGAEFCCPPCQTGPSCTEAVSPCTTAAARTSSSAPTETTTRIIPSTTAMLDANNSDCFERSVGVASSCGLDPVVVRCRAPSQLIFDEFLEGRPLPVGAAEPGPGLPVSRVLASCEEWFEWACGSVGLAVRRAQQCESVCKVVDGAVRAAYGSGCEAPQNCKTQALLPYTCSKEVEYLLWNSCDFAGEAIPLAVEERIGDFTRPYPEEAGLCYGADAVVEGADLVNDGTPPLNVGTYVQEHEMCHDGNACRFACVNQGWSVQRTHDRLAVAFNYVGPCACPELTSKTVVYNTVGPPGDVTSPVAARLSGTHADQPFSAMLFPISSSNQVLAQMKFGQDQCVFAYTLARGGFLGLPDASSLASSPVAAVDFAGFNARESAEDFRAEAASLIARFLGQGQRRVMRSLVGARLMGGVGESGASALPESRPYRDGGVWTRTEGSYQRAMEHAGLRSFGVERVGERARVSRRAMQGSSAEIMSFLGDSCPGSEEECVFACVAAGFRAEVFGSYVLFIAAYEGPCDCKEVFKAPPPQDSVSPPELDAAFMVGSLTGAGSSVVVRLSSVEMLPRAAVEQNISLTLAAVARRGAAETITLDIGPGLCAYTFTVSQGLVLGFEAPPLRPTETAAAGDSGQGNVIQDALTSEDASPVLGPDENAQDEPVGGDVDAETPDTSETQQITETQAKRAADVTLGGIVAGIIVGVGSSVVGAASSALGGSVSASASSSSSSSHGRAAMSMLFQAQWLAVAGRIGGPNGQPQSTRDMWAGLSFLNWHILKLYNTDPNAALGRTSDNTQHRGRRRADSESDTRSGCEIIEQTPGELGGTVLSALVGMAVVSACRSALQYTVWWIQDARKIARGDHVAPFPSWEIALFVSQFVGLAEAAGDAVSSNCLRYELSGAIVLVLLGLSVVWFVALVFWAIRKRKAIWVGASVRETWGAMREQWAEARTRESVLKRLQGYYDAYLVLYTRGDWEQHAHTHGDHHLHSRFVDKYGSVFDGHHGMGWWYSFWLLFKLMVLGMVVSSVWVPLTSATTILVLYVVDVVLHIAFHPDNEWNELVKNIYAGVMNIAVAGAVLAYLDFGISLHRFRDLFRILSLASMIPMVLDAVLGPLLALLLKGMLWLRGCGALLAGGGAGAAVGLAVGQNLAVARGNVDYDTLAAVEEDLGVCEREGEEEEERSARPTGPAASTWGTRAAQPASTLAAPPAHVPLDPHARPARPVPHGDRDSC